MTGLSKRIVLIAVFVGALTGRVEAQARDAVDAPPALRLRTDPAVYDRAAENRPVELLLISRRSRAARRSEARHTDARHSKAKAGKDKTPGLVKANGRVEAGAERMGSVVVKKGDTVEVIADRLNISKEVIIKANRLKRPYELEVGRRLKAPIAKTYVVEHGDTLYAISRRFGVPVLELEDLNHLEHGAHLHLGQRVALPGPSAEETSQAQPEPTPAPKPPRRPRAVRSPEGSAAGPAQPPALPPSGVMPTQPQPQSQSQSLPPIESPPIAVGPTPQPSAAPGEPTRGPIPYTSLPGHLTGPVAQPPERGVAEPPVRGMTPAAPYGPPVVETTPPLTDDQVAAAGRGRFVWPVHGATINGFGPMAGGQRNDGLDIAAPLNTPVVAAADGDVVFAGNEVPGFGNLVLIKHPDGWVTAYAHLSTTEVRIRDHVAQGTEIGRVGQTGDVAQPELHFEVRYRTSAAEKPRPVDPALLLSGQ